MEVHHLLRFNTSSCYCLSWTAIINNHSFPRFNTSSCYCLSAENKNKADSGSLFQYIFMLLFILEWCGERLGRWCFNTSSCYCLSYLLLKKMGMNTCFNTSSCYCLSHQCKGTICSVSSFNTSSCYCLSMFGLIIRFTERSFNTSSCYCLSKKEELKIFLPVSFQYIFMLLFILLNWYTSVYKNNVSIHLHVIVYPGILQLLQYNL